MRGAGKALDWLKKAGTWIRDNIKNKHVISSVAGALQQVGVPYAGQVYDVSNKLGWGIRGKRRRHGGGLRLAGH